MPNITITTPEKLIITENGVPQEEPKQSSSQLDKFLIANASVAVWLIFLAFGGGILALYYARIGYLPEIEWKMSLIYLFIGSIVGGVIALLLTISLYLPGVIWSETLIFDRCLTFTYTPPTVEPLEKEPRTELCLRSIFGYLGLPFLLVLLFSHTALLAGRMYYWLFAAILLTSTFEVMRILFKYKCHLVTEVSNSNANRLWSYFRSNLKSDFSNTIRWLRRKSKKEVPSTDTKEEAVNRHIFRLSSLFTLSVLLNQIAMYLIYQLSGSPAELFWLNNTYDRISDFIVLTVICTASVSIAGHVVALRHKDYPRQAIVASLVAAGLLLFMADKFSSLSTKLMNHYGIGEDQQVILLLNEDGKRIVEELPLGLPKSQSQCSLPRICNVEIFSKVGNEYFLSVGGKTFTLPKSAVLSMQAEDRTTPKHH